MKKHVNSKNILENNRYEIVGTKPIVSRHPILYIPKWKVQLLQFIAAAIIAFLSPTNTFAQLPNLGTAENFVVFTTIGALSNTGVSNITGDIGTNDGAMAGFGAPTVVNGNIAWANSVAAQCAIDVQAAYNELFNTPATVVNHAPAFGAGETLAPGVYAIGAAGSVGGNLTLDAAGNPDAIFIFQFGGAFTVGASSRIILSNGATACNIFWIAEGAIAMAALADVKGTFIANNGAISLGAGGILEGRMLSTAGEAYVYDVLITPPSCFVIYPIDLLSFTGYCDKQNIILQWSTASETNNSYFTVERSVDGINWQVAGTVAGAGNSSSQLYYTLVDTTRNEGTSYYQLKQTDFNGNGKGGTITCIYKCSGIGTEHLTIYPNPTRGKFELLLNGDKNKINSIDIFNSKGRKVLSSIGFQSMFDLSGHVSGVYFILVRQNSKTISLKLVLHN